MLVFSCYSCAQKYPILLNKIRLVYTVSMRNLEKYYHQYIFYVDFRLLFQNESHINYRFHILSILIRNFNVSTSRDTIGYIKVSKTDITSCYTDIFPGFTSAFWVKLWRYLIRSFTHPVSEDATKTAGLTLDSWEWKWKLFILNTSPAAHFLGLVVHCVSPGLGAFEYTRVVGLFYTSCPVNMSDCRMLLLVAADGVFTFFSGIPFTRSPQPQRRIWPRMGKTETEAANTVTAVFIRAASHRCQWIRWKSWTRSTFSSIQRLASGVSGCYPRRPDVSYSVSVAHVNTASRTKVSNQNNVSLVKYFFHVEIFSISFSYLSKIECMLHHLKAT